MLDVLRGVPGIAATRAGVWPAGRATPWMIGARRVTGPLPFVSYDWNEPPRGAGLPRYKLSVTFVAIGDLRDRTRLEFVAMNSGGMAIGDKQPDDLGTAMVTNLWKSRCGVDASVAFA
jgi:hypothetical protein